MDADTYTTLQTLPNLPVSQGVTNVLSMDTDATTTPPPSGESTLSQGVTSVLDMDANIGNANPQANSKSPLSQGSTNVVSMNTDANTTPQTTSESAMSQGVINVLIMDTTSNSTPQAASELAVSQGASNVANMNSKADTTSQPIGESALSQGSTNVVSMDTVANTTPQTSSESSLSQGSTNVVSMDTATKTTPPHSGESALSQGVANVLNMETTTKCANAICIGSVSLQALDDESLRAHIRTLGSLKSKLAGMQAAALAELESRSSAKEAAQMASEDLLSSRRDAQQAIRSAKNLSKVPDVMDALSQGKIPVKHAELIGRIASEGPIVESELLEAAAKEPFDRFNKTAKNHQQHHSQDDGQELFEKRRARRNARIYENNQTGMFNLFAEFDPITGARVATELTALDQFLWRNEDPKARRTPPQRMADALAQQICGRLPLGGRLVKGRPRRDGESNGGPGRGSAASNGRTGNGNAGNGWTGSGDPANGTNANGRSRNANSRSGRNVSRQSSNGSAENGTPANGRTRNGIASTGQAGSGSTVNGINANGRTRNETAGNGRINPPQSSSGKATKGNDKNGRPGNGSAESGASTGVAGSSDTNNGFATNGRSRNRNANTGRTGVSDRGSGPANGERANGGTKNGQWGNDELLDGGTPNNGEVSELANNGEVVGVGTWNGLTRSKEAEERGDETVDEREAEGEGLRGEDESGGKEYEWEVDGEGWIGEQGNGEAEGEELVDGEGWIGEEEGGGMEDEWEGDYEEVDGCGCWHSPQRQGTNLLVIADYDVVKEQLVNGRLADGTSIPAKELARIALEANILPSIFDAKKQPLWLGRKRRVASEAQRIALSARDKGCICCDTTPLWCRAHHIEFWTDKGETDIDNLVLVCNDCHHKIHDKGWLVKQNPNTGEFYLEKPKKPIKPTSVKSGAMERPKRVEGL